MSQPTNGNDAPSSSSESIPNAGEDARAQINKSVPKGKGSTGESMLCGTWRREMRGGSQFQEHSKVNSPHWSHIQWTVQQSSALEELPT
jgi:hypothetical protein